MACCLVPGDKRPCISLCFRSPWSSQCACAGLTTIWQLVVHKSDMPWKKIASFFCICDWAEAFATLNTSVISFTRLVSSLLYSEPWHPPLCCPYWDFWGKHTVDLNRTSVDINSVFLGRDKYQNLITSPLVYFWDRYLDPSYFFFISTTSLGEIRHI